MSVLDAVDRRSLRSCRWALVMPGQMLCACVRTQACLSRRRVLARLLERAGEEWFRAIWRRVDNEVWILYESVRSPRTAHICDCLRVCSYAQATGRKKIRVCACVRARAYASSRYTHDVKGMYPVIQSPLFRQNIPASSKRRSTSFSCEPRCTARADGSCGDEAGRRLAPPPREPTPCHNE